MCHYVTPSQAMLPQREAQTYHQDTEDYNLNSQNPEMELRLCDLKGVFKKRFLQRRVFLLFFPQTQT